MPEDCVNDELIDRYHAGDLDTIARAGVDAHLSRCDRCRTRESKRRAAAERIMGALGHLERPVTGEPTAVLSVRSSSLSPNPSPVPSQPSSSAAADAVFPRVEGYDILRIVGRGGMGIVYEAVQQKLGRHVALKVLPAVVSSAHRDLVERFRREATAASRLHHTNIIPIYDYGESRDGYYYAMELLEGQPLSTVIKRIAAHASPITSPTDIAAVVGVAAENAENLTAEGADERGESRSSGSSTDRGRVYYRQVASWTADAADALHYAHLQGLIHRDIKPANIMVCRDGRVMLLDFGLVKEVSSDSMTATGSLLGTYRYMSPEQVGAKRIRVDARTDVYSLGATLYELLTLQPAYAAADQSELLGHILWKEPTPPRKVVPSVPVDLQTICLKAMEKAPSARYANAREMADDLRQFIGNLPIRARPVGAIGRVAKLARRHPGVSVMSAVVLILAAVFGAFSLRQESQRRESMAAALKEKIEGLNDEALRHQESRNWSAAAASFDKAREIDPRYPKTLANIARLRKELFYLDGNPDHLHTILKLTDEALAVDPRHHGALNHQLVALRELGLFEDALRSAELIDSINPSYYATPVNVGGIHALRGDVPSADRWLRKGVELAPSDPRAGSMPWRNLAALQHSQGDSAAWNTMQEGLAAPGVRSEPGDLAFTALLRLQSAEHYDPKLALDEANAAEINCFSPRRERINRSEAIPRVLALAYLANQQWDQAVEAARSALAQPRPIESHSRLILALAEAHRGNLDEARKERDRADDAWKREINDRGYVCRIENGLLWFVSRGEMDELRGELDPLLP